MGMQGEDKAVITEPTELELKLREGLAGTTPGQWSCCGPKCKCTAVLSNHHPVADVVKGEWGDEFPSLRFKEGGAGHLGETSVEAYMEKIVYGEIPVNEAMRNRSHIANCSPENIGILLDTLDKARAEITRLRECLKSEPNTLMLTYEDGDHERLARATAKALNRAELAEEKAAEFKKEKEEIEATSEFNFKVAETVVDWMIGKGIFSADYNHGPTAEDSAGNIIGSIETVLQERDAAKAVVAKAKKVLKPFAKASHSVDLYDLKEEPEKTLFSSSARYEVKCKHLINAHALYSEINGADK